MLTIVIIYIYIYIYIYISICVFSLITPYKLYPIIYKLYVLYNIIHI